VEEKWDPYILQIKEKSTMFPGVLFEKWVHVSRHNAGEDLSKLLSNAPHDEDAPMKFSVIGELCQQKSFRETLIREVARWTMMMKLNQWTNWQSCARRLLK
jgi:hypothetical protein